MQHDSTPRQAKSPRGKTRFKGIGAFAATQGRNPSHVYRVLTGERRSHLKQLFCDWQRQQEATK